MSEYDIPRKKLRAEGYLVAQDSTKTTKHENLTVTDVINPKMYPSHNTSFEVKCSNDNYYWGRCATLDFGGYLGFLEFDFECYPVYSKNPRQKNKFFVTQVHYRVKKQITVADINALYAREHFTTNRKCTFWRDVEERLVNDGHELDEIYDDVENAVINMENAWSVSVFYEKLGHTVLNPARAPTANVMKKFFSRFTEKRDPEMYHRIVNMVQMNPMDFCFYSTCPRGVEPIYDKFRTFLTVYCGPARYTEDDMKIIQVYGMLVKKMMNDRSYCLRMSDFLLQERQIKKLVDNHVLIKAREPDPEDLSRRVDLIYDSLYHGLQQTMIDVIKKTMRLTANLHKDERRMWVAAQVMALPDDEYHIFQKQAIARMVMGNFHVVLGLGGMGKTHIMLITIWLKYHYLDEIIVVTSLTGRAMVNLIEKWPHFKVPNIAPRPKHWPIPLPMTSKSAYNTAAFEDRGLGNAVIPDSLKMMIDAIEYYHITRGRLALNQVPLVARTMDSYIDVSRRQDQFSQKRVNPLKLVTTMIVEESSMADTKRLVECVEAFPELSKIYFYGDKNQLQPVGLGSPYYSLWQYFHDNRLVSEEHGTPFATQLVKNYRTGDEKTLAENFRKLTQNRIDLDDVSEDPKNETCFNYIVAFNEKQMYDLYNEFSDRHMKPLSGDLHPIAPKFEPDFFTVTYKKTTVEMINTSILKKTQPNLLHQIRSSLPYFKEDQLLKIFTIGQKIMYLQNNRAIGVANGMLDRIVKITKAKTVPLSAQDIKENKKLAASVVDDAEAFNLLKTYQRVETSAHELFVRPGQEQDFVLHTEKGLKVDLYEYNVDNICHGYASTVHKSQGTEYDNVVYLIPPAGNAGGKWDYETSEAEYTGVSRAKKRVWVIGSKSRFETNIVNNTSEATMDNFKTKIQMPPGFGEIDYDWKSLRSLEEFPDEPDWD